MKSENLKILQRKGINIPFFIELENTDGLNVVDLFLLGDGLFAVRSSCLDEDEINNSNAGKYKTFLNVEKKDLKEKVEQVFNSYNEKSGTVIIQKMIDSDLSGVLFTANPMGVLNEMVVTVGKGLGVNVVENKVQTTTYFYNIDDKKYDYDNKNLLSEDLLLQLIEIGQRVENILGFKSDIEFAIKENQIYILQARPITTLNRDNIIVLDNSNIVESYPGISLPLTQSFVKEIYYKIFKSLLKRITNDTISEQDIDLQSMVEVINGRFYYRIDNWYNVLSILPFNKKIINVWQEMLGVKNQEVVINKVQISKNTKLIVMKNFMKYLKVCPEEMVDLEEFFEQKIEEGWHYIGNSSLRLLDILSFFEYLEDSILSKWDITLINDMYSFIYTHLVRKEDRVYLSEIKDIESMKPIKALNDLKECKNKYGEYSEEYLEQVDSFISLYGDRCREELKLETKTYRTNPELLKDLLKDINVLQNEVKEKSKENENRFIKRAKIGISNREKSRMNRSRLFGLTRAIFLTVGERMVEEGRLENNRDIFYLYYDEIKDTNKNYKDLVKERKEEYKMLEDLPSYSRYVFIDKVFERRDNSHIGYLEQGTLQGVGVSEGIVEGEVKVVNKKSDMEDIDGKILVTKMTDPGWVYLIEKSKGIIAEQGSLLSHTAIISRELKKPSIVNVQNVLQLLKDGDKVKIDGLTGKIEKIGL